MKERPDSTYAWIAQMTGKTPGEVKLEMNRALNAVSENKKKEFQIISESIPSLCIKQN